MKATLSPGRVLQSRYKVSKLLAQGGMGAVYRARDLRLNVECAVKEMARTLPEDFRHQFRREAEILSRLRHSNLPRVTDYFEEDGRYYLVMDFIEGQDLDEWVARYGPLPETQSLAWLEQLLDALSYLHRQIPPVIHRDVKPDNIKVTPEGQVFLVDFGVAKRQKLYQVTDTTARAVTPGYSPPEQYLRDQPTDSRSDIYSLGATLYFLLTAKIPPEAPGRQQGSDLIPPHRLNRQITPRTEAMILRAMHLDRSQRWQSADAMRQALRRDASLGQAEERTMPNVRDVGPGRQRRQKTRAKNCLIPFLAIVAALLLLVLVGLVLVVIWGDGASSLEHFLPMLFGTQ